MRYVESEVAWKYRLQLSSELRNLRYSYPK